MTKKQFFEWLSTCPTDQMHFSTNERGIATITFHYDRDDKDKKEEEEEKKDG